MAPIFTSSKFDLERELKWEKEKATRLGDFLHFGQPFKAGGNYYFTQIAHILRQFL